MDLDVVDIDDTNFGQLFDWSDHGQGQDLGCKFCLYWEQPDRGRWPDSLALREEMKRRWFDAVQPVFGTCGKLAFLGAELVAYAQFAPACYLPNVAAYACGAPSNDAVLISCLYVRHHRRAGIGSALLEAVMADLRAREVRAVEALAMKTGPNNPAGPVSFWLKNGFRILREDPHFALVRKLLG